MITILRQNQRILMLVIAVVTIVSFVWLYNPMRRSPGGMRGDAAAQIYDRTLTHADIERQVNNYRLALAMQQFDLIQDLGGMAQSQGQALTEFIFNLLVMQHESKELAIDPTDQQVADRIRQLPVMQENGEFSPQKYATFVNENLFPRGFTERQLEDVVRDSIRLERMKAVVGAPVAVSDAEVMEGARALQKVDVQEIRFPLADAKAQQTVTDQEIQGFYERNRNLPSLFAPETRAVDFVEFALPADQKPEGKEKVDALQKLADAASHFAETARAGNLAETATAEGKTVQTSPEFDRTGVTKGAGDQKSEVNWKELAPTAFALNEDAPVSDVLQSGDKFYILKLNHVNPRRPLTLEEVRPMAMDALLGAKAERVLRESAAATVEKLREAITAGKSFGDAAAALGLKVEAINGLSLRDDSLSPDKRELARVATEMEPGQLSNFLPTQDGGAAIFLVSRAPVDEAELAKEKDEMKSGILENKRRLLFVTWLASAREAAKASVLASANQQ